METICGIDCNECEMKEKCKGCIKTGGQPFGGECVIANCCKNKKMDKCLECSKSECSNKTKLIDEINNLKIKDMPKITTLYQLKGSFVNFEYIVPSGEKIKFWDDNSIYLGAQAQKENSKNCYGIAADDNYILVCEYGENGVNPEIVMVKKR